MALAPHGRSRPARERRLKPDHQQRARRCAALPFHGAWQPLLVGVNIGGAGTLVGSLASLITLQHFTSVRKIFPRATALPELSTGRFLALFSVLNFGFLAILLIACGMASSF